MSDTNTTKTAKNRNYTSGEEIFTNQDALNTVELILNSLTKEKPASFKFGTLLRMMNDNIPFTVSLLAFHDDREEEVDIVPLNLEPVYKFSAHFPSCTYMDAQELEECFGDDPEQLAHQKELAVTWPKETADWFNLSEFKYLFCVDKDVIDISAGWYLNKNDPEPNVEMYLNIVLGDDICSEEVKDEQGQVHLKTTFKACPSSFVDTLLSVDGENGFDSAKFTQLLGRDKD